MRFRLRSRPGGGTCAGKTAVDATASRAANTLEISAGTNGGTSRMRRLPPGRSPPSDGTPGICVPSRPESVRRDSTGSRKFPLRTRSEDRRTARNRFSIGTGAVASCPVLGQATPDEVEEVRAEVGDADPWQDREARVVDHEGKVPFAPGRGPSDDAVAWASFHAALEKPSTATGRPLRSWRFRAPTRVVQQRWWWRATNSFHRLPSRAAPLTVRRSSGRTSARVDGAGSVVPWSGLGQGDPAVPVQGEHGDAGHHVPVAAVGLAPADALAEPLATGHAG